MKTILQLVQHVQDDCARRVTACDGVTAIEEYHQWLPDVKRDEFAPKLIRLTAASLQVPVRCCYAWRIRMLDAQRSNVFSIDKSKIAGVTLYPLLVPGLKKTSLASSLQFLGPSHEQLQGLMQWWRLGPQSTNR